MAGKLRRATWDYDLWFADSPAVQKGDVLRFSWSSSGPLRAGSVQVAALLDEGVVTDERPRAAVVALCDDDYVFIATAIGEDAFRRLS